MFSYYYFIFCNLYYCHFSRLFVCLVGCLLVCLFVFFLLHINAMLLLSRRENALISGESIRADNTAPSFSRQILDELMKSDEFPVNVTGRHCDVDYFPVDSLSLRCQKGSDKLAAVTPFDWEIVRLSDGSIRKRISLGWRNWSSVRRHHNIHLSKSYRSADGQQLGLYECEMMRWQCRWLFQIIFLSFFPRFL